MIRLVLPLPPSVNRLFAPVSANARRGARLCPTPEYIRWQWSAYAALCDHDYRSFQGAITGAYRARIFVSKDMRGDVDGRVKAALDVLVSHHITPDDKHCVSVLAERREDVAEGTCVVEIEPAETLVASAGAKGIGGGAP